MPTIDLFIKSYSKDFWLLYYALDSIKKNVTGYNNLILVIPEHEKELFDTRQLPDRTLIHYVPERSPGWLWQQYLKMTAHKYCFADFICFSDSDCIFTTPVNLQDYVTDGKPEILCTKWEQVGDAVCWREPTEKFIIEPVSHERMRRNNMIFHRSTLEGIEKFAPNLQEFIMQSERFSEFNAMAAYAFKYEKEKYTFVDTDEWTYVPPMSVQVWSHAKRDGSETHLKEWIRILETILLYNGIKPPQKN